MKLLPIFLLAGLSACATTEVNPWQDLTVDIKPATQPLDCGSFPLPTEVVGETIVYDNSGTNALEDYRACSEANKAVVSEHAAQIGELKVARKALVEAGQAQHNIAAMRQQQLEDERRHNFFVRIGQWVLIVALGVAASD